MAVKPHFENHPKHMVGYVVMLVTTWRPILSKLDLCTLRMKEKHFVQTREELY